MAISEFPSIGFVREWDILGCKKRKLKPVIPVCHGTWWDMIRLKKAPPPIKLGPNTTVWRVEDIRKFIADGKWEGSEEQGAA